MQMYDFDVLYERSDGELMAVPDALSRVTMDIDIVLCHRCFEAVGAVSEDRIRTEEGTRREEHESESGEEDVVTVAEMAAAQAVPYEDGAALLRNEDRLRDEDGFRLGGHWTILRAAARVRGRYYWPRLASDVRKAVSECLPCELGRLRWPGVQARIVRYHPSRRFQMVAMDVPEMSPDTERRNRKVLVIGGMFSRYVIAVPISDKSADTVARVFFDR
jgi:hypothetical protein